MAYNNEHETSDASQRGAQSHRSTDERADAIVAMLDASMLTQESMRAVKELLVISDWMTTTEDAN